MPLDAFTAALDAYDDEPNNAAYAVLAAAARELRIADPDAFVTLIAHDRAIAVRTCCETLEGALSTIEHNAVGAALSSFADHPRPHVAHVLLAVAERFKLSISEHTIRAFVDHVDGEVAEGVVKSAASRLPGGLDYLMSVAETHRSWFVRMYAVNEVASAADKFVVRLINVATADSDSDVQRQAAIAALAGFTASTPAQRQEPPFTLIRSAVDSVSLRMHAPPVAAWLRELHALRPNTEELRTFGALISDDARRGALPRAILVDPQIKTLLGILAGRDGASRAVLLVGPRGSGKSALIHELVHRLVASDPHHCTLRITGPDLIAGSQYTGVWEGRIKELAAAASAPRPVLLVTPSLVDLTVAGRWSKSDNNVAAVLADYIERGTVAMIAECTLEAYRQLLSSEPTLLRRFTVVQLEAPSLEYTRRLISHVATSLGSDVSATVLDRLVELSDEYLVTEAQPGAAIGLLRRVLAELIDRTPSTSDVLSILSRSTGVPVAYLDDAVPIDRTRLRTSLEQSVMGQPEAIDAVLERLALIKAGLTDPGRPFAVLLFVGPTGVGKTALAQAIASELFGDPARLVRIDMSEYATYDSFERLLGREGQQGVLTAPIRAKPFSVVLFDEIEKGHGNVFDLCLQLFDAGRLTDGTGATVDFRRTVIILTSNVGAGVVTAARPLGFAARDTSSTPISRVNTDEALGAFFRPEFLNRIDRVVHFVPLDPHVLADIARRELRRVLDRSGLTRRQVTLDIDDSLVSLLLQYGYSPAFGARPLKRAIERRVLQPVAWALAEARVVPGSTLRLAAHGSKVTVKATPPEASDDSTDLAESLDASMQELRDRGHALLGLVDELIERAEPLRDRLSAAVERSSRSDFYRDQRRAVQTLDEIYRLDGVKRTIEQAERDVEELNERLRRSPRDARDVANHERRVRAAEGRMAHVQVLASCNDVAELTDAYVTITRSARQRDDLDGVRSMTRMYRGLADRRGLECEVVDDRFGGRGEEQTITLLVSGAGAHALLKHESGEHLFVRGRDGARSAREQVRVRVLGAPVETPALPDAEVTATVRRVPRRAGGVLETVSLEVDLLHRPSMQLLRARCDATREEALKRLVPLLAARVQWSREAGASEERRVRRYQVGPRVRVKDLRTGLVTARLDRVLAGEIDEWVGPLSAAGDA
jgi:ATP-dependent Clp protease ATP-binding subunit ClpC